MSEPSSPAPTLAWQRISSEGHPAGDAARIHRARVPGGWLVWVHTHHGDALAFLPDPDATWGAAAPRTP